MELCSNASTICCLLFFRILRVSDIIKFGVLGDDSFWIILCLRMHRINERLRLGANILQQTPILGPDWRPQGVHAMEHKRTLMCCDLALNGFRCNKSPNSGLPPCEQRTSNRTLSRYDIVSSLSVSEPVPCSTYCIGKKYLCLQDPFHPGQCLPLTDPSLKINTSQRSSLSASPSVSLSILALSLSLCQHSLLPGKSVSAPPVSPNNHFSPRARPPASDAPPLPTSRLLVNPRCPSPRSLLSVWLPLSLDLWRRQPIPPEIPRANSRSWYPIDCTWKNIF